MLSDDKSMIEWTERDKQTIFEVDLENNYQLLREVLMHMLRFGEILPQFHFEARLLLHMFIYIYIDNRKNLTSVFFQT